MVRQLSPVAGVMATDAAPALRGIATRGRSRWPVPPLLSAIARGGGMAQLAAATHRPTGAPDGESQNEAR